MPDRHHAEREKKRFSKSMVHSAMMIGRGALRRQRCRNGKLASPLSAAVFALAPWFALVPGTALAAEGSGALLGLVSQNAIGASLIMGMAVFALTTALLHLRLGRHWRAKEAQLLAELSAAQLSHERIHAVAGGEDQIIISWQGRDGEAVIDGDWGFSQAGQPLAFGSWAGPQDAANLQRQVDRLKESGEGFVAVVQTRDGQLVEAVGRAVAGRAILLMRDVSGLKGEILRLDQARAALEAERNAFRTLLEALPHPAWTRNAERGLSWVNPAYARAVEAAGGEVAVARGLELLDSEERHQAAAACLSGQRFAATVPAIMAGQRHSFDVVEVPLGKVTLGKVTLGDALAGEAQHPSGSAGMAIDVTGREQAQTALRKLMDAHAATLDRIGTAVAIFDDGQRLMFRNAAFERLWNITPQSLEGEPMLGQILDRLRADRRLNEDGDFRAWKAEVLKAFTSISAIEDWWHLPDGRMLHMVANPSPDGSVTYLFNDVTERRTLEYKVSELSRVQRETLDSLHEGVAVFGADGRVKLFNPAFASAWKLVPDEMDMAPHVDAIITRCLPLCPDAETWAGLRSAITDVRDAREVFSARMERRDGTVLDISASPLPDGATLVAFADVTGSVNVERALKERNEALEVTAKLRDDFVHHVSYELRSPLTNIIGFAQLLGEGVAGPLNERQKDYAGHISRSSGSLLVIINDILDLASIDNGTVTLDLAPVDLKQTVSEAVQGLSDRLSSSNVALDIAISPDLGPLMADGKRLRQVMFNLLSNAISFSATGQKISIAATRRGQEALLSVEDQGPGIAPEIIDRVFDRFESHAHGSTSRGVGLGLSIVRSFVELHGGHVAIVSGPGQGTRVTCHLPLGGHTLPQAAE
jgi:signal transduction histidine kinase